jgi:hypothetical protein
MRTFFSTGDIWESTTSTDCTSGLGYDPTSTNGDEFYVRNGQEILLPDNLHDRPRQEFIEWHMDEVFLGS